MIKVPTLTQFQPVNYKAVTMRRALKEVQVGYTPLYMVVEDLDESELLEMLDELALIIRELKTHPKIPYPLFIVTPRKIKHPSFFILHDKKDITNYFRLKVKKLKKRENNLLKKLGMLCERINNYPIEEYLENLTHDSHEHRALRDVCVEKAFYMEHLEKIQNHQESSDG